jgi:molecular chaperone DnaK (HSP70)
LIKKGLLLLGILALLLTGCGGGDDSNSTTASEASSAAAGAEEQTGANESGESGGGNSESGKSASEKGEESPSSGGGRETAAKVQFEKEAEGICNRQWSTIIRKGGAYVEDGSGSGKSEAQLNAEVITVMLPELETEIERLRELEPPAGEETQVDEYLDELEGALEESEEIKHTPANLAQFGNEFDKANELASQLGIRNCMFYV